MSRVFMCITNAGCLLVPPLPFAPAAPAPPPRPLTGFPYANPPCPPSVPMFAVVAVACVLGPAAALAKFSVSGSCLWVNGLAALSVFKDAG